MTGEKIRTLAEKFAQEQLAIMAKHGSKPALTTEQYEKLVSEIEESFSAMAASALALKRHHRPSNSRSVQLAKK